MNTDASPSTLLRIERELSAPPERVFAALTDPALMNQWFYGLEEGSARVEQDFRVGGRFVIHMLDARGDLSSCEGEDSCSPHGEYREIDPPRRLVFTWNSKGIVEDSVVTITLSPSSIGTRLTLEHELPAATEDSHRRGWGICLDHLDSLLQAKASD